MAKVEPRYYVRISADIWGMFSREKD